jgi:alpha-beta hydrolase superfamily lysophospholipase
VTVQETWFGPADAALLGVWHVPEGGAARGAVVLCPPLGKETVHAYRTMVLAAQQLCELGVAVLRFDYHGCGDSSGDELAPDAVTRWQADVRTAVEHARSTGVPDVALLGLRLGALLAATAAGSCGPLTALALWDPVVSGRRYVREQTVLYRLKVGAGTEGGGVGGNEDADAAAAADAASLVGAALHPAAVTALGATSLASTVLVDAHTPVLLAARAERTEDPVLTALAARTPVTWLEVTGHERVFDVASFEVTLPGPSTAAVTTWLAARFPPQTRAVQVPVCRVAVVGTDAAGHPVVERLVRLGPQQLFGVLTERGDGHDDAGRPAPIAVALPSATEYRVGTGRIWVDVARRLAREGVSCVRFDRRGTGDSGAVEPDEHTPAYSAAAHDDLDAVLGELGRAPERTSLVGHCSGAWLAGEAASEGLARSVVLLGVVRFAVGRQVRDWTPVDDPDGAALTTRGSRARATIRPMVPGAVWRWLGRRNLVRAPELLLHRLRSARVATTLVLAPGDHQHFVANRGDRAAERLRRKGWSVALQVGREGDHSLVHRGLRLASIDHAVGAVLRDVDACANGSPTASAGPEPHRRNPAGSSAPP